MDSPFAYFVLFHASFFVFFFIVYVTIFQLTHWSRYLTE